MLACSFTFLLRFMLILFKIYFLLFYFGSTPNPLGLTLCQVRIIPWPTARPSWPSRHTRTARPSSSSALCPSLPSQVPLHLAQPPTYSPTTTQACYGLSPRPNPITSLSRNDFGSKPKTLASHSLSLPTCVANHPRLHPCPLDHQDLSSTHAPNPSHRTHHHTTTTTKP